MKRATAGAAAFAAICLLWPAEDDLRGIWRRAIHPPASRNDDPAQLQTAPIPGIRTDSVIGLEADSAPVPDPFGSAPPPAPVRSDAPRTNLGVAPLPPPPRPWRATGRVGERAAVLAHPDGRVLVVAAGSRVDSAVVVSIGASGVALEDRAGRFVIRIP